MKFNGEFTIPPSEVLQTLLIFIDLQRFLFFTHTFGKHFVTLRLLKITKHYGKSQFKNPVPGNQCP